MTPASSDKRSRARAALSKHADENVSDAGAATQQSSAEPEISPDRSVSPEEREKARAALHGQDSDQQEAIQDSDTAAEESESVAAGTSASARSKQRSGAGEAALSGVRSEEGAAEADRPSEPTGSPDSKQAGRPEANESAETAHPASSRETLSGEAKQAADSRGSRSEQQNISKAEQIRRARSSSARSKNSRSVPRWLVVAGIVVLIAGGLAILGEVAYLVFFAEDEPSGVEISLDLLAADTAQSVMLEPDAPRADIIAAIERRRSELSSLTPGNLRVLPIVSRSEPGRQLPPQELIPELFPHAPSLLVRTIRPPYAYGVIGPEKQPFLVLSVASHSRAFEGMTRWQNSMYTDLQNVLALAPRDSGSAEFADRLIRNKNVRVLPRGEDEGEPLLSYMFLDREVVAIADSPDVLLALLRSYRTARTSTASGSR